MPVAVAKRRQEQRKGFREDKGYKTRILWAWGWVRMLRVPLRISVVCCRN
jgi:hypothetical protein